MNGQGNRGRARSGPGRSTEREEILTQADRGLNPETVLGEYARHRGSSAVRPASRRCAVTFTQGQWGANAERIRRQIGEHEKFQRPRADGGRAVGLSFTAQDGALKSGLKWWILCYRPFTSIL